MDRFGTLIRLQSNWPGKFGMDRISFLERELRHFDNEVLKGGVTRVLRTSEFPPTIKILHQACAQVSKELDRKRSPSKRYRPGDFIDGKRTFTPTEAGKELDRLRKHYPEAFLLSPSERGGAHHVAESLNDVITRIYVKGLRRCAQLDAGKSVRIEEFTQQPGLF